ncbi:MAG: hypothetical protein GWQ05_29065 [Verrucomicrobiaceae bacterium]|nr:hypothetical protein [Verrucomicrobiaceae bacterium]
MKTPIFLLTVGLCLGAPLHLASAGSLSGNVIYDGAQAGSVRLDAWQPQTDNKSLKLDGNGDFVNVGAVDLSGSALSVEYFFRGSSLQSAVRQQGGGGFLVAGWNGQHIISSDGSTNGIAISGVVTDGRWHHVVLTWEQGAADGFRSYVDGELVDSRDGGSDPIPDIGDNLILGAFQGTAEFTNGELDEVAVWKRVLTPEEVRAHRLGATKAGKEALVGYWNFDDDTATDLSGNGLDGEFGGEAAIVEAVVPALSPGFDELTLDVPGSFRFNDLPDGAGYTVRAFLDADGDGSPGSSEPSGVTTTDVAGDTTSDVILQGRPSITSQPQGASIVPGSSVTVTVEAMGSAPLSYQWRKDDEDIAGANEASYTIAAFAEADEARYSVVVTNAIASVTSEPAFLKASVDGANLAGNATYDGVQEGEVIVQTWIPKTGNQALNVDGDGDFAEITGGEAPIDLSGDEITVEYWFKGSSIQSAVRQQAGGWIVAGWNGLHILSNDGGTAGISAGDATDGQWHHVVMTWKRGTTDGFASYLDGVLVAARDSSGDPIPAHGSPLYFGAFGGAGEFSTGLIDEVAIWRRAFSQGEVQESQFTTLTGAEDGLAGFWNFDDGTVTDLTEQGFDGELGGDAAIIDADPRGLGSGLFQTRSNGVGAFEITGVPKGQGYLVYAFLDANGDGKFQRTEPSGFASDVVDLDDSVTNVEISLTEPPFIVTEPTEIETPLGGAAEIAVVAAGSAPLSYEWRFNNEPLVDGGSISGANSATLTLSDVTADNFGVYTVEVSNALGSVVAGALLSEQVSGFPIAGTVTFDGPIGRADDKALVLDGDGDFVETPITDLSGPELTIQYWFKGSSLQSAVRQQSGGWVVAGWNNTHILSHDGVTDGVAIGEGAVDGDWHHIALTWKQGSTDGFASYVDGVLIDARDSINEPIPAHNAALYFGAFQGAGEFSNGMLDEVSVWSRALSASEIASGYQNSLTGEEQGLVGYWNFNDGTATDLSPNNNDGTLNGDAAIVDSPFRNGAGTVYVQTARTKLNNQTLCVDGVDGHAVVEEITDLSGSELTVQYWFKGSSNQSAVRQQGAGWIVAGWNGQHILSNDGGTSGIPLGDGYNDGQWHHLVMTWKQDAANGFASYLDGQLVAARDSSSAPIPAHNAALYFGAFNGVGEFSTGCIDEVAIWNRALSQPEIQANWNKVLSGAEPGLTGHWNFDDGTVTDLSPGGNNGEAAGGATFESEDIPGLGGRTFSTAVAGGPGAYQLDNVPQGTDYVFTAYLDNNGNGQRDPEEPVGLYESNPVNVSGAINDLNITLQAAAFVVAQPQSVSANAGETVQLSAEATGSEPLTIQWLKNGQALADDDVVSGANTTNLTIAGARPKDIGQYTLHVSNRVSEFTSNVATVSLTNVTPAADVLFHWKLDEAGGASVSDASGNGTHGGLGSADGGAVTVAETGIASGNGISVDDAGGSGSGFAFLSGETETLPELNQFTLSMWVNQAADDAGVSTLASKGEAGDPFALAGAGGDLFWFAGGTQLVTMSGVMTPGTTQHIALSVDNVSVPNLTVIYVDGVEAGRLEDDGNFSDTDPSVFQVGAQSDAFGFKGLIDDVQLYSTALSAANITTLFENPGVALAEPIIEGGPGGDSDSDGDGVLDAHEVIAGTDPNDPTSVFRVATVSNAADGFVVTWQSVADKTYTIEFSTTMNGDWINVGTQASAGAETSFTDTDAGRLAASVGYYRVTVN